MLQKRNKSTISKMPIKVFPQWKINLITKLLGRICTIAISSDGKLLASGSQDKSLKIWDLTTKKEVHGFADIHESEIFSIAFSPDNKLLVSGSGDKSIKIFDLENFKQIHHFVDAHDGIF